MLDICVELEERWASFNAFILQALMTSSDCPKSEPRPVAFKRVYVLETHTYVVQVKYWCCTQCH